MLRADRLLAILLLLQKHGKLPAIELAKELQVSVRTIYRDVDALCNSGIPIYAETGRSGGFGLLENYRTTLTGLNQDEVRALFMLALPETLAEFGLAPELRTAMLKLSAALPARLGEEAHVQNRIYLDLHGRRPSSGAPARLPLLYEAIMRERRLEILYRLAFGTPADITQTVEPLGLVAREGEWYLVYQRDSHIRALVVHRLEQVRMLPEAFDRPVDFRLISWWHEWSERRGRRRDAYVVTVRLAPELTQLPGVVFGPATLLELAGPMDSGWRAATLAYSDLSAARTHLLGLGRAVEVLSPPALRLSIHDFARQIADLYERSPTPLETHSL